MKDKIFIIICSLLLIIIVFLFERTNNSVLYHAYKDISDFEKATTYVDFKKYSNSDIFNIFGNKEFINIIKNSEFISNDVSNNTSKYTYKLNNKDINKSTNFYYKKTYMYVYTTNIFNKVIKYKFRFDNIYLIINKRESSIKYTNNDVKILLYNFDNNSFMLDYKDNETNYNKNIKYDEVFK